VPADRAAGQSPLLTTRTLKYRPDIDGLRAVAVLMVLVFHFSLLRRVTGGFLGVDVFFVISGFLITSIITRQLDFQQFKLRAFYANRIRRLAPALFVVLLGVMGVGVLWLFPSELLGLSKQVLAAQFYFANFYYWQNVNYFGLNAHDLLLLHTWSLAAEEQFYLCFPAFLILLHRCIKRHFWLALVAVFLVSFWLNIFFVGRKPEATFYLFPTRAWELLMGALVPAISARWTRTRHMDEFIAVAGLGLLIVAVTCYQVNYPIPGFYALLPTVGAACLIMSGLRGATRVSQCLGFAPVTYLGKISYSLYLVHWPVSVLARQLIPAYSSEWRWAMLGLSVVLAALIYHCIEDPVRARRLIPASRGMLVTYSVGLGVTLTTVFVVNITHGLPQRFPSEVVRLASYADDKPEALTECEFLSGREVIALDTCHLGAATTNPSWLIYGDSHAWAAHAVFDRWLTQKNEAGLLVFRHACPPLTGIHFADTKDSCFEFNEAVTRFIATHPDFRHIMLVSTWKWPVDGGLLSASHALLTPQESTHLFTDRFMRTVEHLRSLNRDVYVWEPVPGARESVPLGLARAAWLRKPPNLEIDLDEYRSENHLFFDALSKSRPWITASYSPSKILCGSGKCAVEQDGRPLYSDNGHISNSTADIWMQVLQSGLTSH
jgi:peptidoglycan/LPS O-acetylase OafA/YrhL